MNLSVTRRSVHFSTSGFRVTLALGLSLALVACGGAPGGGASSRAEAAGSGQKTIAELNALPGSEQRQRAQELAKEEGGELSLYTSITTKLAEGIAREFEEAYGIKVRIFQGNSETILQKVLQEARAARLGADVVDTNFAEMMALADEGTLIDYQGESILTFPAEAKFEHWNADRYNVILPAWNTKLIPAGQEPKSWEDLAHPRFKGKLVLEIGDADWFANVSKYWLDHGKTEAEVDALWKQIADNASAGKGHTTVMELVSAGQSGIMASQYTYIAQISIDKRAPVAYRTADGTSSIPAFARPNGLGLLKDAPHPASAWLFYDWMLSEAGQKAIANQALTPVLKVPGDDSLNGLSIVPFDVKGLTQPGAMNAWSHKYEDLLSAMAKK